MYKLKVFLLKLIKDALKKLINDNLFPAIQNKFNSDTFLTVKKEILVFIDNI